MPYGRPDTSAPDATALAAGRGQAPRWAVVTAAALTVPMLWLVLARVDATTLETAWTAMLDRPLGLLIALGAFAIAFALRSLAWTSVLPSLDYGQSWAGVHVALGGNHVLPLRLGEPLRVVSAVRRAGIDWRPATASTITLRSADLVAIGLLGALAGLGSFSAWWAGSAVVLGGGALVTTGVIWLRRLRDREDIMLPGAKAFGATVLAWGFESIVVYQAAGWAGMELTFAAAILVTAAAVIAQVAAFAPGGLGTYEAGGVAALVFLGVDPRLGLAVVLLAHAVKTFYALVLGGVAVFVPSPGMFGQFRLEPAQRQQSTAPAVIPYEQPVVLFMPAHDEAAAVAAVVRRVPSEVEDHPVVCLVIDDGSSDGTARLASDAGATVVSHDRNRGLGAAVRTGLAEALRYDPVAVAFCDADGEYAPEELGNLVRPILQGRADYVVGSRFAGDIERMLPHRRFGNLVLTRALSWVARQRISDGQSGFRAFAPRAAAEAEVIHDFNYAQVLTLDLLAKGMRYLEVPISYSFRTTGQSFVKLGRYLRAVLPAVYRELNTV